MVLVMFLQENQVLFTCDLHICSICRFFRYKSSEINIKMIKYVGRKSKTTTGFSIGFPWVFLRDVITP